MYGDFFSQLNRTGTRSKRVLDWFRPTGGPVGDGVRLAVINGVYLFVALVLAGLLSLSIRILRWLIPMPLLFPGFFIVVLTVAFGAIVWYQYGIAHGRAARARGNVIRPDTFGGIGALPFLAFALMLVASGLFALLFAMIAFNPVEVWESLTRIGFGMFFLILAAANVIVARLSVKG